MSDETTIGAGPAGREGQPGPPGREGQPGRTGRDGPAGIQGEAGPVGPILELADAQRSLADRLGDVVEAVEDSAVATQTFGAQVVTLVRLVRRWLVPLLVTALAVGIGVALTFAWLAGVVRDESAEQQQELHCLVAVLYRQEPRMCPGAKDRYIREGILPLGFPTTTTRPPSP